MRPGLITLPCSSIKGRNYRVPILNNNKYYLPAYTIEHNVAHASWRVATETSIILFALTVVHNQVLKILSIWTVILHY